MSPLVQGELLKLRTTRTALGFGAAAVLLVLAVVLVSALAGDPTTLDAKRDVINVGGILSLPLLVFRDRGRHGRVPPPDARARAAHRARPGAPHARPDAGLRRHRAARRPRDGRRGPRARPAAAGGEGGPDLGGADVVRAGVGGVLAAVLCAMLGVGIGGLLRNQVAGVVGALVWSFILEPLIAVLDEGVARYTISQAAGALGGSTTGEALSFGAAALVLAAWTAVFVLAGLLVDRRRDVA